MPAARWVGVGGGVGRRRRKGRWEGPPLRPSAPGSAAGRGSTHFLQPAPARNGARGLRGAGPSEEYAGGVVGVSVGGARTVGRFRVS